LAEESEFFLIGHQQNDWMLVAGDALHARSSNDQRVLSTTPSTSLPSRRMGGEQDCFPGPGPADDHVVPGPVVRLPAAPQHRAWRRRAAPSTLQPAIRVGCANEATRL
jgi:hypothetical protein